MSIIKKKIVVILGPTASGKTRLAVGLARALGGEIVSADSRQVYKGMDIGTGKDLGEYQAVIKGRRVRIPHHLISIVSPKTDFNLAKYQKAAYRALDDILKRKRTPILVGGSGLYLEAVIRGYRLSAVGFDKKERMALEEKSAAALLALLKKKNPSVLSEMNASDQQNKRRLIRRLEMLKAGERPALSSPRYEALIFGVDYPRPILRERIQKRLRVRLEKEGLVAEVERLRKNGLTWKRLESFGLEYRFVSRYLRGLLSYEDMAEKLSIAIGQFAKRQSVWFRRMERGGLRINWIKDASAVKKMAKEFLK